MVRYRRNYVPGGSYFFTVTLRDRRSALLVQHVELLRKSFTTVMAARPFTIDAIVIMPDHLHAIWSLPPDDDDYPARWHAIKARFTHQLNNLVGSTVLSPWQPRYWKHTLRDDADFRHHVDYIHFNPVKHGHVAKVIDWPHSSFHPYLTAGIYTADWGADVATGNFGEPQQHT